MNSLIAVSVRATFLMLIVLDSGMKRKGGPGRRWGPRSCGLLSWTPRLRRVLRTCCTRTPVTGRVTSRSAATDRAEGRGRVFHVQKKSCTLDVERKEWKSFLTWSTYWILHSIIFITWMTFLVEHFISVDEISDQLWLLKTLQHLLTGDRAGNKID